MQHLHAIDSLKNTSSLSNGGSYDSFTYRPVNPDITEVCIRVFLAFETSKALNHVLSKSYSERQFQEQVKGASYPRHAAMTMLLLGLTAAVVKTGGSFIQINSAAATSIGQGLYNSAPKVSSAIFGPVFNPKVFGDLVGSTSSSLSELCQVGSRVTENVAQGFKSHNEAQVTKTQQMHQVTSGDERASQEAQNQIASKSAQWQDAAHSAARAILGH